MNRTGPPPTLSRILVVDDEPQIFETLAFVLGGLHSIEGYTSGEQAIAAAEREVFPVAILDLHMAAMTGIDILKHLKSVSPFTQVIILTGKACLESAIAAVNHGAFHYLLKPFERDPFLKTITAAMGAYEAALLSHERLEVPQTGLEAIGLTPRLAEVAQGILGGKTNEEIAGTLNISPRTVEKHVERLLKHFGISSRFLLEAKVLKTLRQFAKHS